MKKHSSLRFICITSSSKKSGKSLLASFLIRELGAEFAIKVSQGKRGKPRGEITKSRKILEEPETDTAKLLEAGAKKVIWIHTDGDLEKPIKQAIQGLSSGLVIVEGNRAVDYFDPLLTVFLATAKPQDFKPSAHSVISKANIVLIDKSKIKMEDEEIKSIFHALAPNSEIISFESSIERKEAFEKVREKALAAMRK